MTEPRGEISGGSVYSLAEFSQALVRATKSLDTEPVEKLRNELIEMLRGLDKSKNIPESFKIVLLEKFGITQSDYQKSHATQDEIEPEEVVQVNDRVALELAPNLIEEKIIAADMLVRKWIQDSMTLPSTQNELEILVEEAEQIESALELLVAQAFSDKDAHLEATRLKNSWSDIAGSRLKRIQKAIGRLQELVIPSAKENGLDTIISGVQRSIDDLEKKLVDTNFDPTIPLPEYTGNNALEVIRNTRVSFERAIRVLSGSTINEERLSAEELKDHVGSRLDKLELGLVTRVFEQWKSNLEKTTPSLQMLRVITEQARQAISLGSPNFLHISQIETQLDSNKTLLASKVSGKIYEDYLSQKYWIPAQKCLDELKQIKLETGQVLEFTKWKTDVNQLAVFIDSIIDTGGNSLVTTKSYANAVILSQGLEARSSSIAHLIENPSPNPQIEKARLELLKRKQKADALLKERIDTAGKEEWEKQPEIIALTKIIREVRAIDIAKNIAPHCGTTGATCYDTAMLESGTLANPGFKLRLTDAHNLVISQNLLDNSKKFPQSKSVGSAISGLNTNYGEATRHLDQCIRRSKEQPEVVSREWFEAKILKIEETYAGFKDTINVGEYNAMIAMRDKLSSLVAQGKIAQAEVDYISTMISARKELNDVYRMVESTQDIMIETIRQNEVDLRSSQLGHLFRHKKVGAAWRIMDRIMTGQEPALPDVDSSTLTADRDRVIKFVTSQTDPASAMIAYRLYRSLFRASELDILNAAVIKDQVREVIHFSEFRRKYKGKDAESGPQITLTGYFDYNDQRGVAGHAKPVIYVLPPGKRDRLDTRWDLFPGFFHHCYEGTVYTVNKDGVEYKRKMTTNLDAKGNIIDFMSYRNAQGELMVENMPWDNIEEDALATWYRQMKNTAHFIKGELIKTGLNSSEYSQVSTYQRLTNTLTYLHPFIYGLRDQMNEAVVLGERAKSARASGNAKLADDLSKLAKEANLKAKEIQFDFQYMYLLGLIHHNFQVAELSVALKRSQVRDILRVAVKAGFITGEHSKKINKEIDKMQRLIEESLLNASERSRKELFDI